MGKSKKLVLVLVLTLVMGLLTACGGQSYNIQLNEDGSGTFSYGILLDKSANDSETLSTMSSLVLMGFTPDTEKINNKTYVTYTKAVTFADNKELKGLLANPNKFSNKFFGSDAMDTSMLGLSLTLKGCVVTGKTFQVVVPGILDREEPSLKGTEMEGAFTRVGVTFSSDVVSTNGKKSSDGKSVTWTVPFALNDTLLQATTATNPLYTVDSDKPVVKGVKDNTYYKSDDIEVTLTDNVGVASATVNGKKMGNLEYFENDASYVVRATDFAGNKTKVTFYIDTTAPTVKNVAHGKHYKTTKQIKFSDKNGVVSATLNGKTVKNGAMVSKAGLYTLKVKDKAGNVKRVSFRIDKSKPVVKGVSNGTTYRSTRTIKFSDNGTLKSATLNGKKIKSGKKISSPGKYKLVVTDKAGNVKTVNFRIK